MSWTYLFPVLRMQLPATQKLVAIMLADAMSESGIAEISYGRLARRCGLTRRTAIRTIEQLRELVDVGRRGGLNTRGSGRGGHQINTFRARWEPKLNGDRRSPLQGTSEPRSPDTVIDDHRTPVIDDHPYPGTYVPVGVPGAAAPRTPPRHMAKMTELERARAGLRRRR